MDTRPWFVSFTAIWKDAEGFNALRNMSNIFLENIPFNHFPVRESCWHFTVLPILRATKFPTDKSAEDIMLGLCENIWKLFQRDKINLPELFVEAYEAIAFDSGTCIQFSSNDGSLEKIRGELRKCTKKHIDKLLSTNDGLASELEPMNRKNSGNASYGSIARAVTPECNSIRWRSKIDSAIALQFKNIYLLASDEYLSNPSAHDNNLRKLIELGF